MRNLASLCKHSSRPYFFW